MSETGIHTTGRIVKILADCRYHAALPNGKVIFAFPSKALRDASPCAFEIDDLVTLRLTPYDFSKAEITGVPTGEK